MQASGDREQPPSGEDERDICFPFFTSRKSRPAEPLQSPLPAGSRGSTPRFSADTQHKGQPPKGEAPHLSYYLRLRMMTAAHTRARRHAALRRLVVMWMLLGGCVTLPAANGGDLVDFWQRLTGPHDLKNFGPPPCEGSLEQLAREIGWLEHHLDTYGSIVVKHPDVWGQSRLMRHRQEYEEQLRAQLDQFAYRSNAALRRSDQAYLGMAMALQAASGRRRGTEMVPVPAAGGSASVINQIQSLLPTGNENVDRPDTAIIGRTQPLAFPENPPGFQFDDGPISLEPTLHLDQLSRYLNHLHELRRINEGDDIADAPGYAMALVRLPVSIMPGGRTRRGYGAEATLIAEPVLDDDLLPRTFRSLVVNDLVDLVAPALAWCVNDPSCVRWAGEVTDASARGDEPDDNRRSFAITALAERLPIASPATAPAVKSRRSRMPIPFTQLVEASGVEQIAVLIRDTHTALAGHPTSRPCIGYSDVRGFLEEEIEAAYDLLAQPELAVVWQELPAWHLAASIRGRRATEIDQIRCRFLSLLGTGSGTTNTAFPWAASSELSARPQSASIEALPPLDASGNDGPCCTPAGPHPPLCRTTTAVLAWGILVESALLDQQLASDMQQTACDGFSSFEDNGPFFGPHPPPAARMAFNRYVLARWPLHVFALDPVVQEQNIEDSYARRRETQIAMAMAFASGRMSAQALTRFTRRMETDMATVALNRTAVAFSHGSDSFGWRFYPRVQSPPTRGALATLGETLCGPSSDADLAARQLEPGMRECTAILVMPSFVPAVSFDVRTNWFQLAHPRCTEPSLEDAVTCSRAITQLRQSASRTCIANQHYRGGELVRLLKRVDQLDRELPLQTLTTQVPYENTAGGFELFSAGTTALAPELIGWYGAPGIDPESTTSLYLIGRGFSVHDTSLIAGGRPVPITLISREVLRADIPPGVGTLPALPHIDPSAVASDVVSPSSPPASLPTPPTPEQLPAPAAVNSAAACGDACRIDCHGREMVDLHLATPYGVTAHMLVPVARRDRGVGRLALADTYAIDLAYTTGKSTAANAEVARVDEFYGAAFDAIVINVPTDFLPPAKGLLNFTLVDPKAHRPVAVFAVALPVFDTRRQAYVLTGSDLRNFVGDTSRPATDKTLRGAIKPYLDALLAAGTAPAVGESLTLELTASLAAEGRDLPVGGRIRVSAQRR